MSVTDRVATANPIQRAAGAVGAVFVLVGILGFVPGVTADYGSMTVAGHESGAALLGIFQVNVVHNLVHLLFGLVGLAAARSRVGSRAFLLYGGIVYLVVWLGGLVIDLDSALNILALNTADNWLHLLLGAGMVGLGAALGGRD